MTSTRLRYPRMLPVCVAICLVAGQCFAAAGAPELPDPGKPRMTRDEQKQLGLQVAAEVYKQMPVQPDSSPETQYIQALGKRLVNTIPADRSWPFQFHVIAQKEINPIALPDFFQKLAAEGNSGPQFLSDHPNPGNRRTAIQAQIKNWPNQQYSSDSDEFASVRKHATGVQAYDAKEIAAGAKNGRWTAENKKNGVVFPDAPATAAAPAGAASMPAVSISAVQPSPNFQIADLGGLRIARPQNWEVIENRESSATIAPRAGVSGGAVAYGVVIRAQRAPAANMSASKLTEAVAQSLQSGDGNLKVVWQIQRLTVG